LGVAETKEDPVIVNGHPIIEAVTPMVSPISLYPLFLVVVVISFLDLL